MASRAAHRAASQDDEEEETRGDFCSMAPARTSRHVRGGEKEVETITHGTRDERTRDCPAISQADDTEAGTGMAV